ncbi:MAG: hypothetical protein IKU34_12285 [Clostridia bacterium]|nr:hypothetical protein [Clostridia bacterium]
MANMFRPLRADEIDVRVGVVREKGISLLLYKDARCDMNILDETVGPYNWKRTHSRENANCVVEIWDEKKGQWIGKEDTGTESNTEAEKGLASDSFKRACVNWGIGRELYTAPFVWLRGDGQELKKDYYTVTAIAYDERGNINRLKIENDDGKAVFDFSTRLEDLVEPEPIKGTAGPGVKIFDATAAIKAYCEENGLTATDFGRKRRELINAGRIPEIGYNVLDEAGYRQLIEAFEAEKYE